MAARSSQLQVLTLPPGGISVSQPGTAIPVLVPGNIAYLSWGATTVPANQGLSTGTGYSLNINANWDMVPFQDKTSTFYVGVMAFKSSNNASNNVDHVDFAMDGGPWVSVYHTTVNPDTGYADTYVVRCEPGSGPRQINDGTHEIRAIAYPVCGVPRVLQGSLTTNGLTAVDGSMVVTTNAGGSVTPARGPYYINSSTGNDTNSGTSGSPYLTISKGRNSIANSGSGGEVGGGTIYLQAGTYTLGAATENFGYTATNRWLTISAAPGVAQASVIISGCGGAAGIRTQRVRLKGLTVTGNIVNTGTISSVACQPWSDGCAWVGGSQTTKTAYFSNFAGIYYASDSTVSTNSIGFDSVQFQRNITLDTIGENGFGNCLVLIGGAVTNLASPAATGHPEVCFFARAGAVSCNNLLVYGLTANTNIDTAVMLNDDGTADDVSDTAIVNCNLYDDIHTTTPYTFNFARPMNNGFILNCKIQGSVLFDTSKHFATNSYVFANCSLSNGAGYPGAANVVHYP
jgi:hypothetical protein